MKGRSRGVYRLLLAGLATLAGEAAHAEELPSAIDLTNLSVQQLADVEIISVSKRPEPLSEAPAAAYVISHDDIENSGATSIPEMLRLAPNLEVMQTSPENYVIASRGFSGNTAAQNFPDKLLVIIDGRSVYSPLYSGVYWDMQDVLPEDIERIEVISGPGATLWGANAVNGVINIVTRNAADTQGGLLDLGVGSLVNSASLQYGGRIDSDFAYRVYAKDFYSRALDTPGGIGAEDGWSKPQGGFRLDWTPGSDTVTLEGDLYGGNEGQASSTPNQEISGANVVAHLQHPFADGSTLQVQAYYDQERRSVAGAGAFTVNTYDLDVQHDFALGSWNSIVWGAGGRLAQYRITDSISAVSSLLFVPPARTLGLGNLFAEDTVSLGRSVRVVLGMKLEDDPYWGLAPLPSIRASWDLSDGMMLWAAASRAVRSPTPFDEDVVEDLGPTPFLSGNPDFEPEALNAYELGYRGELSPDFSLSVSLFEDAYGDLKNIEFGNPGVAVLKWGNMMKGDVYGMQAWASYQVNDWWRLSAGLTFQHEDLRFYPGSSALLGVAQAGDDPNHQASLRSSMRIADGLNLETDWRYVGVLHNPQVPEYVELNATLGWKVTDDLTLSLSGFNLLHAKHMEFPAPSDEVQRNVFLDARWNFK